MKLFAFCIASITAVASGPWGVCSTLTVEPIAQFPIHRTSASTAPIFPNAPATYLRVQYGESEQWVDEAFVEFPLAGLGGATGASFSFEIENPPGNQLIIDRTFQLSTYASDGVPSLSRLGAGQFISTSAIAGGATINSSRRQTFNIDVTPYVVAGIAAGDTAIGFRFHTPADITPGSDSLPIVYYTLNSGALAVTVPEPSGIALAGALGGLLLKLPRRKA